MQLVGMLDSPYVRRVAISLRTLQVPFEHRAVSVFSTFEQFKSINPVVKAPSLVCDDGTVLMDSSLILQFVEASLTHGRALWSSEPKLLQAQMRIAGLALAACEKSVQIVYERNLRPKEAQHEPWVQRVTEQLLAAYGELEQEVQNKRDFFMQELNQAAISTAVAWQFSQSMLASLLPKDNYEALTSFAAWAENTPEFMSFPPMGPGVQSAS